HELKRERSVEDRRRREARTKAEKKRVQCGKCGKSFCDKGALKIHNSAVHLREMHKYALVLLGWVGWRPPPSTRAVCGGGPPPSLR
uniref:C2H2-type domain-containing protein n=1 Tax=Globodera pallida TaxID=36090 RepID=A0A183CU17_GLOPA